MDLYNSPYRCNRYTSEICIGHVYDFKYSYVRDIYLPI